MSDMTIREECACGARIEVVGGRFRNDGHQVNPRSAEEVVERWRADHQHAGTERKLQT